MIICCNDKPKDAPSTEGKSQTHQTNFRHQCLLLFRSWSQTRCVLPIWFTSQPLWLLLTIQSQISPAQHQGHLETLWKTLTWHCCLNTTDLSSQWTQCVCVLAESMEAIKILPIPTLPATQGTTTLCSGSNSPVKLTQAFTPFQSPSKKHKIDM